MTAHRKDQAHAADHQSRILTGRLVHEREPGISVHHMTVQLFDRDVLNPDDWLGEAQTDANGHFELTYHPRLAGLLDEPDFELRVVDHPWDVRHEGGTRILLRRKLQLPDQKEPQALGAIAVPFWEYQEGPLARLQVEETQLQLPQSNVLEIIQSGLKDLLGVCQDNKPQRYAYPYVVEFARVGARFFVIRAPQEALTKLDPDKPALDEIQAPYPENVTMEMERDHPGLSRGDAWLVDRILNGFHPCLPLKDPKDSNHFHVAFNWDDYPLDGEHDLPNVDLRLGLQGKTLQPLQITIQSRLEKGPSRAGSPLGEPVVCKPEDGERWQQAKRIFRTSYLTAGESDAHLSKGHVNMEQYAVAAFRNFHRNPLGELLFPHLKELVLTNDRGSSLIFGVEGILTTNSALTAQGVEQRIVDQVSALDWFGWQPRKPLCDAHRFAKVANGFWRILTAHVEQFIQERQRQIQESWYEVKRFSDDLVRHGTSFRPVPDRNQYYDTNELAVDHDRRVVIANRPRTISPVTLASEPQAGDWDRLRQVCSYAIYHATFWHSWCHNRQGEDGGELRYATLALRNGGWSSEDDFTVAPKPIDMVVQLFIANVLIGVQYGYITKNEDGDIPPNLISRLQASRQEFLDLGFDIDEIRSRINI